MSKTRWVMTKQSKCRQELSGSYWTSFIVQSAKHCADGLALTWGCCETRNRTQVAVWPLVSKPAMKMAPTSGSSRSSASGLPAGII